MKRKNRKTVMIAFIIVSIFLSACGENREYGTKMGQEPEGLKAAELAVVNPDDAEAEEEKTEQDSADAAEAESNGEIDSEDGSNQEQPELYTDEWVKENVTGIWCSYYEKGDITQEDIDKISQLTNLERLHISIFGEAVDLSPLGGMASLESLSISAGNDEVDLSPLGDMVSLESLSISVGNDEVDLSFLKQLVNLRELRLEGFANVQDLSFLENMPYLQILHLGSVEDVDLNYLANNKMLRNVGITGQNIRNPEGMAELKYLEEIYLADIMLEENEDEKLIFHMDSIGNLQNLKYLSLYRIRVEDVSPLSTLENLKSISLESTGIENIAPLKEIESLRGLFIYGNDSTRVLHQAETYFNNVNHLLVSGASYR